MKLAVESEQALAQTARDPGVHANTLHTWLGQYHRAERQAQQVQDAHVYEELKRRRQANACLQEERDLVKNSGGAPRHLEVEKRLAVGSRRSGGGVAVGFLVGGTTP